MLANEEVTIEGVEVAIWCLSVNFTSHEDVLRVELPARWYQPVKIFRRLLCFQILLPIQRARLDEACCIVLAGCDNDHICRKVFILIY